MSIMRLEVVEDIALKRMRMWMERNRQVIKRLLEEWGEDAIRAAQGLAMLRLKRKTTYPRTIRYKATADWLEVYSTHKAAAVIEEGRRSKRIESKKFIVDRLGRRRRKPMTFEKEGEVRRRQWVRITRLEGKHIIRDAVMATKERVIDFLAKGVKEAIGL